MPNNRAAEIIAKWEGCRLEAYRCPAGKWTIGYGHTAGVTEGERISQAEADALLREDIETFAEAVDRTVHVPLNENQRAALISWTYNVGIGAMKRSTLVRKLNEGDYASVPPELTKWRKSGNKVLPGLVNRRKDEIALWRDLVEAAEPHGAVARPGWLERLFLFFFGGRHAER